MRQKLITLDPTSFEIASKMPNFSDWVRKQLRKYRNSMTQKSLDDDYTDAMAFWKEHGRFPKWYSEVEE